MKTYRDGQQIITCDGCHRPIHDPKRAVLSIRQGYERHFHDEGCKAKFKPSPRPKDKHL